MLRNVCLLFKLHARVDVDLIDLIESRQGDNGVLLAWKYWDHFCMHAYAGICTRRLPQKMATDF